MNKDENNADPADPIAPGASPAVHPAAMDRESGERLFIAWQGTIDRLSHAVARRYRLGREETEDFVSEVRVRMIANDYGILRQFRGRSGLRSYLDVVIHRQMLDRNNAKWGKWRPSQASKRLGPIAVELERLTTRDGLPFEQACALLEARRGIHINRGDFADLRDAWTPAPKRHTVSLDVVCDLAAPSKTPHEELAEKQVGIITGAASALLQHLIRQLPAEDRRILELRFDKGQTIAHAAQVLNVNSKAMYRRMERLLRELRRQLERAGFDRDDVLSGIGCTGRLTR